ncbi:hypothetical protein [Mycolicibacterium gilvum]|uniref:hypothetical protein n=1 Tax=Mycolicibacterium TaxID=1866885 RepID=UPI0015635332|nr:MULTISPECIES: hypothetical protein [Mycolicibacterium]
MQHGFGEGRDSDAHRTRCGVDPFLPSSGGQPLVLVGGHRQAVLGEERFQSASQ